jgi:transcription initiation factor IIE alpha subunit
MEKIESNLIKFFGGSPVVAIIDALVDNIGSDYSKKEIQELAGISKGALFKHWKGLEPLGIIKPTRKYGKTILYTLNTDSQIVKDMIKWEMDMIELKMPNEISKEEMKVIAKKR